MNDTPNPPTLWLAFDGLIGDLPDEAIWVETLGRWVVPVEPPIAVNDSTKMLDSDDGRGEWIVAFVVDGPGTFELREVTDE